MRTNIYSLNSQANYDIVGEPSVCPFCTARIVAIQRQGIKAVKFIEILYQCTNEDCKKGFIAYFEKAGTASMNDQTPKYRYLKSMQGSYKTRHFSEIINEISPKFQLIFNQANNAEEFGLNEIAGMGFRKALEFLIKDYIIKNKPDLEDEIKSKFLGRCINENIKDIKLKETAKRAVWLGNDETHYVRKWDDRDITDLKQLIQITIHWIEMESMTANFISDM